MFDCLNTINIADMTREEAINEIKTWAIPSKKGREVLETLIPELRESEDEKIRKALVWHLKAGEDFVSNGVTKEECITYLEKQKEQSVSAEEVLARAGLKPYKDGNKWCILAGDNIQEGICGFGDTIDEALYEFLKEVIDLQKEQKPKTFNEPYNPDDYEVVMEENATSLKRKEQKPVDYEHEMWKNCEANFEGGKKEVIEHPERYGLQKPAEWSKEDDTILTNTIIMLKDCAPRLYSKEDIDKSVALLKSLRPQPKQEWSEEDEKIKSCISLALTDVDEQRFNDFGTTLKDCLNWLKSLRPNKQD